MSSINAPKQTINTIIIVVGIGLLLYDFIANPVAVYFKISGLVILMFGLYKSTQQWTSDNKAEQQHEDNTFDDNADLDEDVHLDDDNIKKNGQ